jgi:branched-chain amino acid transport system substrate-binding protein
MWGWGVMNQVAVQEAANIRFPMDNFIGIWWSGAEHDVLPAGEGADGYKVAELRTAWATCRSMTTCSSMSSTPAWPPATGPTSGTVLYVRGVYAAMLAAEAARKAQEIHGVADITPAMMRDGMEALEMSAERGWKQLGARHRPGLLGVLRRPQRPGHCGVVQQWDATRSSG